MDRDWLARRTEIEAWPYDGQGRVFGVSSGSLGLIATSAEPTRTK